MHSLSADLLLISDTGLKMLLLCFAFGLAWWSVFRPTICGLVPGCLAMLPAIGILAYGALTVEALMLAVGLHAFGYDWSVVAAAPKWAHVVLAYVGMIVGIIPALGLAMGLSDSLYDFRKQIEHDSAFVGLDYRTLWKPSVLFHKCSPGIFYGKEFLRAAIFFLSTGLALFVIGYENMTTHVTFVFLWAVLSSVLVVVSMYAALTARLVLCPIRKSA